MQKQLELYVQVVDIARALCLTAESIARDGALGGQDVAHLVELRHALEQNAHELATLLRDHPDPSRR